MAPSSPTCPPRSAGSTRPAIPAATAPTLIFYVGINLGAFLAPLVCGTLGERVGWHYGFAAAGVGMLIGLAIYLYAYPQLPPDRFLTRQSKPPLGPDERRAVVALLILFVPMSLFWATYEQQGNTIALWADQHTDRTVESPVLERGNPHHLVPVLQPAS